MVLFAVAVPVALLFAGLIAAGAWRAARSGGGLQVTISVSAVFFGLWQSWTIVALAMAEREGLDLRRFLAYPVPLGRVWLLGLLTSLVGDPFGLFWGILLCGAWAGAAAARPGAWLLPLALCLGLFAAGTVALVALLQELLARLLRLRFARELAIVAGVGAWLLFAAGSRLPKAEIFATAAAFQWLLFPPALGAAAARALFTGHVAAALPWLAAQAATALLTGWAAWRLALRGARSGDEERVAVAAAPGRRNPWPERLGPVFEQQGRHLARHPVARLTLLFLPAIGAVLAWRVVPHFPPEAAGVLRALPLFALPAFSYLMLQETWLNAFGLDRGGARTLLLAPLPPERILLQKNLAVAAAALAGSLLAAAAFLAVGGAVPAWALAGAALLQLALAPLLLGPGNLLSILNPSPASFTYQRGKNLSALSSLAGMGIFSGAVALLGLPALLAIRLDEPWALPVAWAVLGGLGWAAYLRTLPRAGALLLRRREQLLGAVTGQES